MLFWLSMKVSIILVGFYIALADVASKICRTCGRRSA